MKKVIFSFILLLGFGFNMTQCGLGVVTEEAEKYADEFYNHMRNADYDGIIEMLDDEALAISPKEDWIAIIQQKDQYGKFEHLSKDMNFNTSINNGVTTVSFHYTAEYTNITFYEILKLVKRGNKFKILSYEYNNNKDALTTN